MPNLASVLKVEILRLARKEVRKELDGLRKASAQYRSEIAELKRRVASLEKEPTSSVRRRSSQSSSVDAGDVDSAVRFSAKGFASHRNRLGVSASEAGRILHVSAQTIYGWESGTKPRRQHQNAIAAFRKMGKRDVKSILASSEA